MILRVSCRFFPVRRSPCGERGLKFVSAMNGLPLLSRSPCGERGLKCRRLDCSWCVTSRSPCGERGLKCKLEVINEAPPASRSPCGERGLKYVGDAVLAEFDLSLPVRGAWIEMCYAQSDNVAHKVAPRAGSVD